MDRRKQERRARRLSVSYQKRGDSHIYSGYSTNISEGGLFLGTVHPFPRGTRVRVEILDRQRGFTVEGVVAHARKLPPELRAVQQSGMGIRFLEIWELVRGLFPSSRSVSFRQEVSAREEVVSRPAGDAGPPRDAEAQGPPPAGPPPHSDGETGTGTGPIITARTYQVDFPDVQQFLEVYHRDLQHGGLFIVTREPAARDQTVTVELLPPVPDAEVVRFPARVVRCFLPEKMPGGRRSGMGVEIRDPESVLEKLRPVVELLET